MNRDKHYATDDGRGMKVVGVLILFSITAFMAGLLIAYVGDTYVHPSFSAASPRSFSK
jgi:hypothetical protein